MLRTPEQYLGQLRDGREVYIGGERVEDVTAHPAFAEAAKSVAALYGMSSGPGRADLFSYVEDGAEHNVIFKRPRNVADLAARRVAQEAWAGLTYGLMGRSPDHVAGFITGMACEPEVISVEGQDFDRNIVEYWRHIRDNDLYVVYAVVPPTGVKTAGVVSERRVPTVQSAALRVVAEDAKGVTIEGFKILATGAILADEVLVGNLHPLAPGEEQFAITCAVPIAARGLKLLSRKPFELHSVSVLDDPLAARFDETDAVLYFDNVHVPWERVFTYNHLETGRTIFYDTPGHSLGNAQAHVRLLAKLRLILGVVRRVAEATQIAEVPAVRERIAGLAVRAAIVEALILAQEIRPNVWPSGYVSQDKQTLYATMSWTCDGYPGWIEEIRELLGSTPFQMPANISTFESDYTRDLFTKFTQLSLEDGIERYKLLKLAWDLVGSEFANRHLQYEMLYTGARHVTRGRAGQFFNWDIVKEVARECLAGYGLSDDGLGEERSTVAPQ